jgi:hypothetical protein
MKRFLDTVVADAFNSTWCIGELLNGKYGHIYSGNN